MVIPKSILFGLEQTRGDGAAQLPLGDTDWLLADWELPWNSGWSRAPPELSSAGLIRLKAKAEAVSPSCHPLPCAPLPGSCHSWVAVRRPGLQQQPSCSTSAIEREKKNQPKSRFGASLVAPVLCHGDFFYKPEPRIGVRAHDCSRKQCGPQLLGWGCDEPAQEAESICLPDFGSAASAQHFQGLGRRIYSAACCSPLVATLLLLGKHSLKFCMGGERVLESKTNSYKE